MDTFKKNWRDAELTERQRALSLYAHKLTREPENMTEGDLEPLRQIGLDDLGILHLVHVIGFFSYANRVTDGLGCDLEPEFPERP